MNVAFGRNNKTGRGSNMKSILRNKWFWAFLVIIAVGAAGYRYYSNMGPKDDRVKASGTVEVQEVQLSPQASGRIIELNIDEAQQVRKGQLIARMSLDGAGDDVEMAQSAYRAANEQLRELQNGFRKEDIAKAKAQLSMYQTQYDQAVRDQKRFRKLADEGAVAVRDAELYTENANAKRDAMNTAKEQLRMLNNGARSEQIAAAQANVKRAAAAIQKAKTLVGYKTFYSPADGVILTKNYELGDVIAAGSPLATLGNMSDCWVKLYIPSTQLGLVKLGQKAEVKIDSYPGKVFEATVTEVNQQAEYNPRLSLTQSERSNMVFWIKISIKNTEGVIKPGMPADVTLL